MVRVRYVLAPVLSGAFVALLSGLYDGTPSGLVGAVWYGLPFTWLRRMVVAPQYYPWVVDWAGLASDLAVWIVIFGVVSLFVARLRGPAAPHA